MTTTHSQKGNPMNPHSRVLVHHLLALQLETDRASIQDAHTLDDLGVDALDLVFFALRLEQLGEGDGEFPVDALEDARTVGDLVEIVDLWMGDDATPGSREDSDPERSSAA